MCNALIKISQVCFKEDDEELVVVVVMMMVVMMVMIMVLMILKMGKYISNSIDNADLRCIPNHARFAYLQTVIILRAVCQRIVKLITPAILRRHLWMLRRKLARDKADRTRLQ